MYRWASFVVSGHSSVGAGLTLFLRGRRRRQGARHGFKTKRMMTSVFAFLFLFVLIFVIVRTPKTSPLIFIDVGMISQGRTKNNY